MRWALILLDGPVTARKVEKWGAIGDFQGGNLAQKNCVIAGWMALVREAIEVRKSPVEPWRTEGSEGPGDTFEAVLSGHGELV